MHHTDAARVMIAKAGASIALEYSVNDTIKMKDTVASNQCPTYIKSIFRDICGCMITSLEVSCSADVARHYVTTTLFAYLSSAYNLKSLAMFGLELTPEKWQELYYFFNPNHAQFRKFGLSSLATDSCESEELRIIANSPKLISLRLINFECGTSHVHVRRRDIVHITWTPGLQMLELSVQLGNPWTEQHVETALAATKHTQLSDIRLYNVSMATAAYLANISDTKSLYIGLAPKLTKDITMSRFDIHLPLFIERLYLTIEIETRQILSIFMMNLLSISVKVNGNTDLFSAQLACSQNHSIVRANINGNPKLNKFVQKCVIRNRLELIARIVNAEINDDFSELPFFERAAKMMDEDIDMTSDSMMTKHKKVALVSTHECDLCID